jgi:hypothetical protein
MKRTVAALGLIMAVACGVVAAVPAPAMAADRTVTLTLKCTNITCSGGWAWYQGGTSGTLLSSGSVSGTFGTTTTGTAVQPATADTVIMDISSGRQGCGTSQTESFSPGSGINFTLKLDIQPGGYFNYGCRASFNMKS